MHADYSTAEGVIATEHLQFETPDEDTIIITEVMFGCGLVNIRKSTGKWDGVFRTRRFCRLCSV